MSYNRKLEKGKMKDTNLLTAGGGIEEPHPGNFIPGAGSNHGGKSQWE
jgi:hypothetical protein